MHEFSIANQAVDKIMEAASEKRAKKIHQVELVIGELNMLGKDEFIFCMKEILSSKGEIASDVMIDLKQVDAEIRCGRCGYEGSLKPKEEDHHSHIFHCPSCDQTDIEIRKGKECILNRIKLEV